MRFSNTLLAGAACIFPLAAQAQTAPIVVTGELAEADARPGGADVVPATEYEDRVAVSLRDALAFSPGVYTQPRFGQEVRISIRGSGISRGYHMRGLTLLQDGIPINLADDNGDFQELDPQVFEAITVYRGGNALRFGGSTLGGAINAVTPTGRTAPGYALRIDGGSFDTVRAKAAAGFSNARGDAWMALTTESSDGDRDHAKRFSLRFNGNVGLKLTERIETRFYASVNHIKQDLPGSLPLTQALSTPEISLPGNIAQDQERDVDSIRLQNRTRVDLGGGSLTLGGFWNAKQLSHPIFQVIDQKSNDRGVFASFETAGRLAGAPVELTLGTQARYGTVAAKQFVNVAGERGTPTAYVEQRAHTINSYGEVRVRPVGALTLIAGAVYSVGAREIDNRFAPANDAACDYDALSPKIGAIWQPLDGVQFFANASRSVEFPGFGELVQGAIPGFVDLDPQRAWTYEAGTRGTYGIARWELSLYRAEIRGEMLQYTVDPDIPASTFNAGRTLHQGIEAAFDLEFAPWALLRQIWAYSDFRFQDDAQYGDNRLPVVPRHFYRAEMRLGDSALSLTPRIEWAPQGAWADYRNTLRTPGYALLGLGAEAAVSDGIVLFADARNLTGKNAAGDISASIQATPASVAFYPVERRALYGGVRMRF